MTNTLMKRHYKKLIFILIIVVTILISAFFIKGAKVRNQDNLLNRFQCIFFDKNTINVTGINIDLQKIVIESVEGDKIIFKNGQKTSGIKNEYGGDNFKIFYDDKLIGQAGIFKTNWWYTHDYFFEIVKTDTNTIFHFKVIGPSSQSINYKFYQFDSLNNNSTEVFYNFKGKTGQININYFNKQGDQIADEMWEDGILVNMNTYSNGNWLKNYTTNKYSKTEKFKLIKLNQADSLVYIYQKNIADRITNERIAIKN